MFKLQFIVTPPPPPCLSYWDKSSYIVDPRRKHNFTVACLRRAWYYVYNKRSTVDYLEWKTKKMSQTFCVVLKESTQCTICRSKTFWSSMRKAKACFSLQPHKNSLSWFLNLPNMTDIRRLVLSSVFFRCFFYKPLII